MLYVHRSERADPLAAALAQILVTPLADPFARELIAVPTRGMERWLTQRLSARLGARPGHSDGIAAAIDFPFPGRLVDAALAAASGIDPEFDPWLTDRLVWPLIDVTQAAIDEAWLTPLAMHLRPDADGNHRRFSRIQQLAQLFNRYATYRPQLLLEWLSGDDNRDGAGPWQAELFRRLRATVGEPGPAERLAPACERLREDPGLLDLPGRLAVFGLTRLPSAHLEVLRAIAAARDVNLMVLHPSPVLWDRTTASASSSGLSGSPASLKIGPDFARNRLLSSWGRESEALGVVLAGETTIHHPVSDTDSAMTLLRRLQRDIRADQPAPGMPLAGDADQRFALTADDASVRVHSCHGRARQVEVLREAILHRLQDDPTLEPRDVIVMCPNVEVFAPLIEAAFEGGQIPVRLADRSLRQTNPILGVIARLLDFPAGRVTASDVLDLADSEPLRRRFSLRDDDLSQFREWVSESQIHWGLSADDRAPFKLSEVDAGTWAAGLRRLLLAVAIDDDAGLYAGTLPVAQVDSGQIALAGRVAELAERLRRAVTSLRGPQTIAGWTAALAGAADALAATDDQDDWQRRELDRLLADAVAGRPAGPLLSLPEFRALVGHRLQGRPTRANFRTGHLTVCTLSPMRSVPHRVVCLLGLDDGHFPRVGRRDGDDLLLQDPRPGDRDPRAEDRQLLLDALLAADDQLIITYTGNDERTNAPRPPAVPVGELLDAIDASARVAAPEGQLTAAGSQQKPAPPARSLVVIRHPLQSFDARNFTTGSASLARDQRPWSFDKVSLAGAQAFSQERLPGLPFLSAPLPPAADSDLLALDDLVRFVERPIRAFLRQRLGLSLVQSDDEVSDTLPVQLDPLERWGVGQRLLEALIAGTSPQEAYRVEIARGSLPPGMLGRPVVGEVLPRAAALARAAQAYGGSADPRSLETNVVLADGTRLTGTVSGVRGNVLLTVSYSRLNPRHRLAAWVRLLALTAAHPEIPFETVTVARARGGAQKAVEVARVPMLGGDEATRAAAARAELETLVQLRLEGMREPLPLPPESTFAFAQAALLTGEDAAGAALEAWNDRFARSGGVIEGEHSKDENPLVIGPELDLTRLAALAPRLWQPLLAREKVERA